MSSGGCSFVPSMIENPIFGKLLATIEARYSNFQNVDECGLHAVCLVIRKPCLIWVHPALIEYLVCDPISHPAHHRPLIEEHTLYPLPPPRQRGRVPFVGEGVRGQLLELVVRGYRDRSETSGVRKGRLVSVRSEDELRVRGGVVVASEGFQGWDELGGRYPPRHTEVQVQECRLRLPPARLAPSTTAADAIELQTNKLTLPRDVGHAIVSE
mmetsp:Transcript_32469/g.66374  ORF Transcript_32469/g.66374 Transcript_32469/m.66374 type:complete len:212 (-) Transcript_32469:60-695(-)